MQNPDNSYIIDVNDPAEQERLSMQDTLITRCMGDVLPEDKDYRHIHTVLDLGCGPGAWALTLSAKYPWMDITGIDISRTMIEYARAQAHVRKANVAFEVMDVRHLDFEENSFDFINARLLSAAVPKDDWPGLWQRCYKILRPGGILRWSEADIPQSSSAAFEEIYVLLAQAMHHTSQSFSATGYTIGLIPHMVWLLKDAGFEHIEQRTYSLDSSNYMNRWQLATQINIATFILVKPLLLRTGVVTEQRFDALLEQVLIDIEDPRFTDISLMLSLWTQK